LEVSLSPKLSIESSLKDSIDLANHGINTGEGLMKITLVNQECPLAGTGSLIISAAAGEINLMLG